jgi:hypothetical protein
LRDPRASGGAFGRRFRADFDGISFFLVSPLKIALFFRYPKWLNVTLRSREFPPSRPDIRRGVQAARQEYE